MLFTKKTIVILTEYVHRTMMSDECHQLGHRPVAAGVSKPSPLRAKIQQDSQVEKF